MNKAYYLNVDTRNRINAGECMVGETSDTNLNDFVAKVVEMKPESVFEIQFELGQRLANLAHYGIQKLGGWETDLLYPTYGNNYYSLYAKDIHIEISDEINMKKNWDLVVLYCVEDSKKLVDYVLEKGMGKTILIWRSKDDYEVIEVPEILPGNSTPAYVWNGNNVTREQLEKFKETLKPGETFELTWGPELDFKEPKDEENTSDGE